MHYSIFQFVFICFVTSFTFFPVGYTTSDVLYRWNSRAVAISEDLRMSQFDLIEVPSSNESVRVGENVEDQHACKFK